MLHPSIQTIDRNQPLRSSIPIKLSRLSRNPPPSLARPVAFKQTGRRAETKSLQVTSPASRRPLANRAHLHAFKGNPLSHFNRTGRAVHAASTRDHTTTFPCASMLTCPLSTSFRLGSRRVSRSVIRFVTPMWRIHAYAYSQFNR
jgi:hypothetical protein